jgi:hypothetical protein
VPDHRELQRAINESIAPWIPSQAWQSTVAVVVADPPKVHQLGSGTLFQIADAHFVVTAAHVVQGASDAGKTIGISGGPDHHFVSLAGKWWRSSQTDGDAPDRYDLAVYRLPDDAASKFSGKRFLRLSDATYDPPGPRAVFTLFGFPGIWTESITAEAERLSVRPLEFTTYAYDGSLGGIQHYEPRLHILLSAGSEDLSDSEGSPQEFRDRLGQSMRLPIGLKGISGCGVWHIGDLDTPIERWAKRDARLAGVACAVYQAHGAVKVTRWIAVTTLINAAFPDLRSVLKLRLR